MAAQYAKIVYDWSPDSIHCPYWLTQGQTSTRLQEIVVGTYTMGSYIAHHIYSDDGGKGSVSNTVLRNSIIPQIFAQHLIAFSHNESYKITYVMGALYT